MEECEPSERKPNPAALLAVISHVEGDTPCRTVYVGDSLTRDILMANRAKVPSVLARYGISHTRTDYDLLVQISHWTDDEVSREREFSVLHISPSAAIDAFDELPAVADGLVQSSAV